MIRYHSTYGLSGEVCVEWDGFFVGFIAPAGERRWRAYGRTVELIGNRYRSRADAAAACYHNSLSGQQIRMSEFQPPATVPALAAANKSNGPSP